MSLHAEKVLIAHLVDAESLGILAREDPNLRIIPTAELRPIIAYAVHYYYESGLAKAPSIQVLRDRYGPLLDDAEIDLVTEPEDSLEWALEDLTGSHLHKESQTFVKKFATAMGETPNEERQQVFSDYTTELVAHDLDMQSRAHRVDLRQQADNLMRDYEARVLARGAFMGLGLGLAEVDSHTYGIHPSELAILAAPPKCGKSYFLCHTALKAHQAGQTVALFTLENSVPMMTDRIACMAANVDSTAWQRGTAEPDEVERIRDWTEQLQASDTPLWILQPDIGQRTFERMVREAQVREAEAVLIDQLTFVELPGSDRASKTERIGNGLHVLKGLISMARRPMSAVLAHQINREGIKRADKAGHLELYDLAESAEVERTADFIFSLYQSNDQRATRKSTFQILGARRTPIRNWLLQWRPEVGVITVRSQLELDQ